MADPQLSTEAVRVTRGLEAQREAPRRRRERSPWHRNEPATNNVDVSHVIDGHTGILERDAAGTLIVQSPAEPRAEAPPTRRINPRAYQELNRIVRQSVRSATTYVLGGTKLPNALEMLINREIETDAGDDLIRTIQQRNSIRSLWITVQDVPEVGR